MSNLLFDEKPLVISPALAKAVGLNESIVLQQVHYWLENNKKNNRNFIDGKYWTYNSISDWHKEYFAFWSERTVERIFNFLEKKGILVISNYNKDKRDRTKWYTIDYEKLKSFGECNPSNCHNSSPQFGDISTDKLGEPLPENNTENNTENKDIVHSEERTSETAPIEPIKTKPQTKGIDNVFECLWALYPKKRGKGQISHTTKKRLYDIGIDEIRRCIERYSTYCQDKDMQFWQNGSTFFSSGYIDYLDANYVDIEPPVVVVQRIHVDN